MLQLASRLPDSTKITLDSCDTLKYRVSAAGLSVDYTLVTKFVWQDFEGFTGKKFYNGANNAFDSFGFTFTNGSNEQTAYVEAVSEDDNLVLKVYEDANHEISVRRENIPESLNSRQMVFGFDYKAEKLDGRGSVTIFGGGNNYYDAIYFNADGTMSISNGAISIGKYNAGEWYKVRIVLNMDTGASRVYINDQEAYSGNVPAISTLPMFKSIIFKAQKAGVRTCYLDNFVLYPIASVEAFDASGMQSAITSDKVKISDDKVISGYGTVTAKNFVDSFITVPAGATAAVYTADSTPVGNDTTIASGMKLIVNAKEEGYRTVYTFGDGILTDIAVQINSRPVDILYAGTASAQADVFVATATQMKLKLEKFMNSDTSTAIDSAESALTAVEGEQTLTCALTNPVADEPGTSLVATLLDSAGAVIATRTVSYSETLEYTTEVAKVKDNRKAIYTITMDDGYLYSTQKYFEPWFEKYDLRGTTVAVYNCFKDGGGTYTGGVTPQMNREYFHEALTKGNFEIGSHSNTHPTLAKNGVDNASESTIRYETLGSIPTLERAFPGQQILTFTAPAMPIATILRIS